MSGLLEVAANGRPGEKYNLGGAAETSNLELARRICALLDEAAPRNAGSYADQLSFVTDRPGHDFRYAIDSAKAEAELGWRRDETLDSGLAQDGGLVSRQPRLAGKRAGRRTPRPQASRGRRMLGG